MEAKFHSKYFKKYKGKTLVIEVWASWCGDCVKQCQNLSLQTTLTYPTYFFLWIKRQINGKIEKHN
jgi:thiol-disulfide isomerase/thioredoxin